ncbi:MAG: hypothetical protein ABR500_03095 [Dermatophilaceae bacterium]
MSTFILGTDDPDVVRRYATEVAPAVRDLVAVERERRAGSVEPDVVDTAPEAGRTALLPGLSRAAGLTVARPPTTTSGSRRRHPAHGRVAGAAVTPGLRERELIDPLARHGFY